MTINTTPQPLEPKYIIVKAGEENLLDLIAEVDDNLAKGFKCMGGIAVRTGTQSGAYLLQAMVKNNG